MDGFSILTMQSKIIFSEQNTITIPAWYNTLLSVILGTCQITNVMQVCFVLFRGITQRLESMTKDIVFARAGCTVKEHKIRSEGGSPTFLTEGNLEQFSAVMPTKIRWDFMDMKEPSFSGEGNIEDVQLFLTNANRDYVRQKILPQELHQFFRSEIGWGRSNEEIQQKRGTHLEWI